MMDQIKIGDKASLDDFAASMAGRKIKMPAKKKIKETVPFSNITYDFTKINDEIYWEERELEYTFEIIADTPEELEELKSKFAGWVSAVFEDELRDPYIFGYHFRATYDDMSWEDDEGMDKTTATVTFTAYPYMIADYPRVYEITIPAASPYTLVICNDSAHKVTPTISTSSTLLVHIGTTSYTIGAGDTTHEALMLEPGDTAVTFENPEAMIDCTVRVSFYEEVL